MGPRLTSQTLELLAAMLDDPSSERYGFDLLDRTALKAGTLYPILARLEAAAWLESRWEDLDPHVAGRPRRRLYRLTAEGSQAARAALDEHLARLQPPPRVPGRARPSFRTGWSAS